MDPPPPPPLLRVQPDRNQVKETAVVKVENVKTLSSA